MSVETTVGMASEDTIASAAPAGSGGASGDGASEVSSSYALASTVNPPAHKLGAGGALDTGGHDAASAAQRCCAAGAAASPAGRPDDTACNDDALPGQAPAVERVRPNTGFSCAVGRGQSRVQVIDGRELVRQGQLQGWQTQVFVRGDERRRTVWEVLRDLLVGCGAASASLVIVSDSEEIDASEALGRLGTGGMRGDEKVFGEGECETLVEALGKLAAAAATGPAIPPGVGPAQGVTAARPIVEARSAAPRSPGMPSHAAAREGGYLDERAYTGGGHRPSLPKEGSLLARDVKCYYGKESAFSNLNGGFGSFKLVVSRMDQAVVDVLGYDLVQVLGSVDRFRTVEHGLHFFKFLIHGQVRTALELLDLESVWEVMSRSKETGWGFNWQLWDAVAYEVLLGLVRMKALSHPRWMAEVARYSTVYLVEASPSNRNCGVGCSSNRVFDADMRSLGHNFAGESLNRLNDEHRGAVPVLPPTLPGPGTPPVTWGRLCQQSPVLSRRRDMAARAQHYHGGEGRRSGSRSPAPSPGGWGPSASAAASARASSWGSSTPPGAGHVEKMARRALSPQPPPPGTYGGEVYGAPSPLWGPSAGPNAPSGQLFAPGSRYGNGYGLPFGPVPPPLPPPMPPAALDFTWATAVAPPKLIPPPPGLFSGEGWGVTGHPGGGYHVGSFADGDMRWQPACGGDGRSPDDLGAPTESGGGAGAWDGQGGATPPSATPKGVG
jgi:hypothetical protein